MNTYIYLSKIAISISLSGNIEMNSLCIDEFDLSDIKNKIELINILLIAHKKRYLKCFTDEQRDIERHALIVNYTILFGEFLESFISVDVLLSIFDFIACENLRSTQFRENCIRLIELAPQFNVKAIQNAIFSKLMRVIIGLGLYGEEPFDFILGRCVELLGCDTPVDAYNFTFLE